MKASVVEEEPLPPVISAVTVTRLPPEGRPKLPAAFTAMASSMPPDAPVIESCESIFKSSAKAP